LILALFLISLTVKELMLWGERKRGERELTPVAPEKLIMEAKFTEAKFMEVHPAYLEAPPSSASAEEPGMAAGLLALGNAVPNIASGEIQPEHQSPQYNQPQYNQPQYNQEDARVE